MSRRPYSDFMTYPSPYYLEEDTENELNEELKSFHPQEATVLHASKAPRPPKTKRTSSVTGDRDETLDEI
jgi:hypothetical protein